MKRSYRFSLRPLVHHRAMFESWRTQCCVLYNAALEQRITAWRKHARTISCYEQFCELTDLRHEPDWRAVPALVQRSALQRLDRAYQAFFRRVKSGEKAGFPRFRARDRYDSFGIGRVTVEPASREGGSGYVHVPKLGRVRFKQHRPMQGVVRDVTIRCDARGRWFVQVVCDLGDAPPKRIVGVNRSTGIENPRFYRHGEETLARAQRVLSAKQRGSRSRARARQRVARAHEHVRNQRLDFHRKTALALVRRFDAIAHEDLNIRGLARTHLAKSVHDVGWAQFIRILHCKAEEAGVHVIAVDPRGTTQTCSWCGAHVPKGLGDRVHRCPECGVVAGRDHNSAREVHARGLRAIPAAMLAEAFRRLSPRPSRVA